MATWVEDIVQALINLGGQATLTQIYEEVKRIRTEPLPDTYKASIRERIEAHSSDSTNFKGNDKFKKINKGVWALREKTIIASNNNYEIKHELSKEMIPVNREAEHMATWLEDIVQALQNLGGKATRAQIIEEVRQIRPGLLPPSWKEIISQHLQTHSSDSEYYDGKKSGLFKHLDKGVWSLRNHVVTSQPVPRALNQKATVPQNFLPPESFEEISNILRTIKQYREYQHPDSPSWKEYVDEFFHVLGFSTDEKNQRIMTLNLMGANHTPKAIVCYVKPGENFDEITPGLEWESYLFYAAKFHQVEWGILTDGLQLKVIQFKDQDNKEPFYWPDLDGIVCKEKLDTFCTIYKVFSFIKGCAGKPTVQGHKKSHSRIKRMEI